MKVMTAVIRAILRMFVGISLGAPLVTFAAADITSSVDPNTGLKSWQYEGDGLGIELLQVPPDFIRASYAARGLPEAVREAVATRCVFGTIVRNLAPSPLTYRVADWRYVAADGSERRIKTKSEWLEEWHGCALQLVDPRRCADLRGGRLDPGVHDRARAAWQSAGPENHVVN